MQVNLSDLKIDTGKPTTTDGEPWHLKKMPEQITSVEQLFGTLPSDTDLKDVRTERLSK